MSSSSVTRFYFTPTNVRTTGKGGRSKMEEEEEEEGWNKKKQVEEEEEGLNSDSCYTQGGGGVWSLCYMVSAENAGAHIQYL